MKEFMLLYKGGDPDWFETTSPEEIKASMDRWSAWMGELQEQDKLISGGSPLHYSGRRMTQDGLVTDIAASEFKELISGYSIIAASDINEAIRLTKSCPIFEYPNIEVEVREVQHME